MADIAYSKQTCQSIPVIYERWGGDEIGFEVLGNGMIELELRNKDDLLYVGVFLRFLHRTTGEESYCLKEICQKRGLFVENEN